MTLDLHLPTLFTTVAVASAAMGLALASVAQRDSQGHGSLQAWSLAMFTHVVAYGLFSLRGVADDLASVVVANIAVAGTIAFMTLGVSRFLQRPLPPWVYLGPVLVVAIGFWLFLGNFKVRLLLGGVVYFLQVFFLLRLLYQHRNDAPGRGKFIFGFPLALFALAMLGRVVGAVSGVDSPTNLTDATLLTALTFLSAMLTTNLAGVGGLMMVRERSELALADSEARYRKLIEGANEGICVLEGTAFRFINPEGERLVGVPAAELVGQPFLDFIHPDDRAMAADNHRKRLQGAADDLKYPVRILTRHRGARWFEVSGVAVQWQGRSATLNFLTDITERRQAEDKLRASEARLRLLTDNARDVVWSMAPDGAITYISSAVEKVRGYTPEEAMQQSLDEILMPHSIPPVVAYLTQLHADIQAGRSPQNFRGEQEYRCKGGGTYWAEVLVYPIQDEHGALTELVGISRDLSERKRYEATLLAANTELLRHRNHLDDIVQERTKELAQARDLAQGADRAKTALLANVSHELRTPLNHIVGNAYMLAERLQDREQKQQAATIVSASRQLLALVNDMIEMARLESQQIHLDAIDFSLRAMLDRAQSQHRRAMEAKGLKLVFEIDADLPDAWVGDPIRLGQVLHHFLDNATKYSEHGQVTLACHRDAQADAAGHPVLRFEVRDQGVGIAEEQRRRLFTLFEQGDGSSTRRQGGTGLGLAFARRVVGLMGGQIGVDSQLGQGSCFWFTVTLEPARVHDAVASSQALAPDDIRRISARMESLLAQDDASALGLWQESRPVFTQLLDGQAERFGQAVEQFEFSQALQILRQQAER